MKKHLYNWEETVILLNDHPIHRQLMYDAYLTHDLEENCFRFSVSDEFCETLTLIKSLAPRAKDLLDIPSGNGVAAIPFANAGYQVTVVEPDGSSLVGRGAIKTLAERSGLDIKIYNAWGEDLPFESKTFDVVYVRQGLHHAFNLSKMVSEISRVLRPGGVMLACREHVIDDHENSLNSFLATQVDHQYYGGENAYKLSEYRDAIIKSGLSIEKEFGPYDSVINWYPNSKETFKKRVTAILPIKHLLRIMPWNLLWSCARILLKFRRKPGRLFTFVAVKSCL